jgi:predicted dinucleotide-binding enzyme
MNIGVLGTGQVGEAIATALTEKGHNVRMGSRTETNEKATAWVKRSNDHATQGTFDDAAGFGDLVFLCLNGSAAVEAVKTIHPDNISGKIVIDLTNPLDFSHGMPPRMIDGLHNHFSLGEAIQRALPGAMVVKTLNTVNYKVMVDANLVNKGDHNLFLCGDHPDAKNKVQHFLTDSFGWRAGHIIDLGGMEAARAIEAILPFWVLVYQRIGSPLFNFKIVQ